MSLGGIILILLVVLLLFGLPANPYNPVRDWGYTPSGTVLLVIFVLLVLVILGKLQL